MATLLDTLGNVEWFQNNRDKLEKIFPEDWLEVDMKFFLHLGMQAKLLGIDWQTNDELSKMLQFLASPMAGVAQVQMHRDQEVSRVRRLPANVTTPDSAAQAARHRKNLEEQIRQARARQDSQVKAEHVNRSEPPPEVKLTVQQFLAKLAANRKGGV